MVKRAAGMLAISAVLCGIVAAQAPEPVLQDTGSAQENSVSQQLIPTDEPVAFAMPEQAVGIVYGAGLQSVFVPASDYGQVFPYAAKIVGWKDDGTAVYRYALADAAGELVTDAVYNDAQRLDCGDSFAWLLTDTEGRLFCVAQDGSWAIGPVAGEITAQDDTIFVHRADGVLTDVYNLEGKNMGAVHGSVTSCTDGVIVSKEETEEGTIWYVSDGTNVALLAQQQAVRIGPFSDGYAAIQISDTQWGFIDTSGEITQVEAAWLDDVCEGYALAQDQAGAYGIVHVSGEVVEDFVYTDGTLCGEEHPLYQLWQEDESVVISATNGQKLDLPENLGCQSLNGLPDDYFSYVDSEEECTVIFDDLKSVALESYAIFYQQDDYLIAMQKDSYQIFDLKDGKAGRSIAYRYIAPQTSAGLDETVFTIADTKTGLQGIGNTQGRMVLHPVYDSISSVGGSYYMAIQDGWSGIVDSRGRWIVRTQLSGVAEEGAE